MGSKTKDQAGGGSANTSAATAASAADRRTGRDRRSRPTRALSAFWGHGQRRVGRRRGDADRTYVDSFTPGDVALLLGIFLLNIFDALFTLMWLQRGGEEANPLMAFLLDMGEGAFLIQKCIVVGIWLVVLLIHKNFRLARIGLYSLAAVYTLVIVGHFAWMASGTDPRHPAALSFLSSEQASEQSGQSGLDAESPGPETDSL